MPRADFENNHNEGKRNESFLNCHTQNETPKISIKKIIPKTNNIYDLLQSTKLCNLLNDLGRAQRLIDLIAILIKYS